MRKKISENFYEHELRCKCNKCKYVLDDKFLKKLQALRTTFDYPIKINSWYRCPEHNEKVGGKPDSCHIKGRAVDISTVGFDSGKKYRLLQGAIFYGFNGIGVGSEFIHIDIRKTPSLWIYS